MSLTVRLTLSVEQSVLPEEPFLQGFASLFALRSETLLLSQEPLYGSFSLLYPLVPPLGSTSEFCLLELTFSAKL